VTAQPSVIREGTGAKSALFLAAAPGSGQDQALRMGEGTGNDENFSAAL